MIRLLRLVVVMSISLPVLASCVIGAINTRDEFVAAMKSGGPLKNVEHTIVNRPAKAVVADMAEYAKKCLNVRVSSGPSYRYKAAGGSTTYRAKIEATQNGATAMAVQEKYNDRDQPGAPPGGFFVLVAEVRPTGNNKTQADIYHNSRSNIANSLKEWIAGDRQLCPSLERVL